MATKQQIAELKDFIKKKCDCKAPSIVKDFSVSDTHVAILLKEPIINMSKAENILRKFKSGEIKESKNNLKFSKVLSPDKEVFAVTCNGDFIKEESNCELIQIYKEDIVIHNNKNKFKLMELLTEAMI